MSPNMLIYTSESYYGKNKRDDIRALIDSGLLLNNTQSNLLLVTWQWEFF